MNPARSASLHALQEWETGRAFADETLHRLAASWSLSTLDRSFVTETFYGVLRNRSLLDFLILQLRGKKPLDARTRNLLRLGLYQIFHMRVPDHAAVGETVGLAEPAAKGLVNALLRRSLRERTKLESHVAESSLSTRTSHPEFLVDRWLRRFGEKETLALCEANNRPAEIYARCNLLRVTPGELHRSHPEAEPLARHPDIFRIRRIPPSWIVSGLCYIQDPSTLTACELLDPQPGDAVLDACAAPGGKTAFLAQLMHNEGSIAACDVSPHRMALLRDNVKRLGVTIAGWHEIDWARPGQTPWALETFDRILLDAPCSNTGVLRRRVDARWRLRPEDFRVLPALQTKIAKRLLPLLKPGGTFVYSTCSIEPEENREVIETLLAADPSLQLEEERLLLPHRDGFDGVYAARLTRLSPDKA